MKSSNPYLLAQLGLWRELARLLLATISPRAVSKRRGLQAPRLVEGQHLTVYFSLRSLSSFGTSALTPQNPLAMQIGGVRDGQIHLKMMCRPADWNEAPQRRDAELLKLV